MPGQLPNANNGNQRRGLTPNPSKNISKQQYEKFAAEGISPFRDNRKSKPEMAGLEASRKNLHNQARKPTATSEDRARYITESGGNINSTLALAPFESLPPASFMEDAYPNSHPREGQRARAYQLHQKSKTQVPDSKIPMGYHLKDTPAPEKLSDMNDLFDFGKWDGDEAAKEWAGQSIKRSSQESSQQSTDQYTEHTMEQASDQAPEESEQMDIDADEQEDRNAKLDSFSPDVTKYNEEA